MPTLAERLVAAATALAPVTETPRLESELLLMHALGLSRAQFLARLEESPKVPGFESLLKRRLAHEPIAYILREHEFFSLGFYVEAPLLVPRPETEHLVEAVLDFMREAAARVLEIGTGTGCVAVAIARCAPNCRVWATDVRTSALAVARRNAERHQVAARIDFVESDLFSGLPPDCGPFDVVCSNPPYVEDHAWSTLSPTIRDYEDATALRGGKDGLDVIRRLCAEARPFLRPGGLLAFEMGMGQYNKVRGILAENGYERIRCVKDLATIDRIALAINPL
ncbi:MAG: peptide chain release factor N(5)-glutamine methyltransferase [Candidatus Hydrogenedentes bacterium]|nr:peptide chain release factor N(5)-glutamine methyltransferase [Candidatus Hydrogenedentota bacterium]